jgi:hypothetical protein
MARFFSPAGKKFRGRSFSPDECGNARAICARRRHMKTILRTAFAVTLLSGAALAVTPALAGPLGGGLGGGVGGTVGGIGGGAGGMAGGGLNGVPTVTRSAGATTSINGGGSVTTPSTAPVTGAASNATNGAEQTANGAVDKTESNAEAAQNNATTTLNNTASANATGSANADVAGKQLGASKNVSSGGATNMAANKTRHVMGEANSGLNQSEAATNDAQAQAAQDLNRTQASGSASGSASANGAVH